VSERAPVVPFRDALRAWARIAALSFGGPVGQIGIIHRTVVDERRWLSEAHFQHALSFCMLLPGPEATQLATYCGWYLHGVRGGIVAGALFVLPGFLAILGMSVLYVQAADTAILQAILGGLKPAVIVVVLEALLRMARRSLVTPGRYAVAIVAFLAMFVFTVPFPLVVIAGMLAGFAFFRDGAGDGTDGTSPDVLPRFGATLRTAIVWILVWLTPLAVLAVSLGSDHVVVQEGRFFSQMALVTFGGAYSVLSYVADHAVNTLHWLSAREMLDGLGMAETTPGPLIMVVQFVAFLGAYRAPGELSPMTSALIGSVITTWVTFVPSFLFIFVGSPYLERLRRSPVLQAGLRGIQAAVFGVVLNLAVWFALHTLFARVTERTMGPVRLLVPDPTSLDWRAALLVVLGTVAALWLRAGLLALFGGAALAGLVLYWLAG
jgi:chromate transporter